MIDLDQFAGIINIAGTIKTRKHIHVSFGDHYDLVRVIRMMDDGQVLQYAEPMAKLIAAAPDLLAEVARLREQLRIAVEALEYCGETDNINYVEIHSRQALAAIKAEGGE